MLGRRRMSLWGSYVNPLHRRKPSRRETSLAKCLRRFEKAVFSSLALSIHHDSRAAGSQLLRAMHSIWRHKLVSPVASMQHRSKQSHLDKHVLGQSRNLNCGPGRRVVSHVLGVHAVERHKVTHVLQESWWSEGARSACAELVRRRV